MISQSESGVAGGPIGAESVTLNRSTTTTCRSSTNMAGVGVGEQQNFWRVKLVKHCFAVGDLSESHWEVYNQEMLVWKEGQDLVTWTHQKTSENLIVWRETSSRWGHRLEILMERTNPTRPSAGKWCWTPVDVSTSANLTSANNPSERMVFSCCHHCHWKYHQLLISPTS